MTTTLTQTPPSTPPLHHSSLFQSPSPSSSSSFSPELPVTPTSPYSNQDHQMNPTYPTYSTASTSSSVRPPPTAVKKAFVDLGRSSIRSSYSPPPSPLLDRDREQAGFFPPSHSEGTAAATATMKMDQGRGTTTGSSFRVERTNRPTPSSTSGLGAGTGFVVHRRTGAFRSGRTSASNENTSASASASASAGGKRRLYYAVAEGYQKGIYETWNEAEIQIKGHPSPRFKTFKTKLAAESYLLSSSPFATLPPEDAETGGYDMQLELEDYRPPSSSSASRPYELPLHERLQRDFPSTVPNSAPTPAPALPLDDLEPPRAPFARKARSSSAPSSPVKRSSPLRQEVTEQEELGVRAVANTNTDGVVRPDPVGLGEPMGKKGKRFSLRPSFMSNHKSSSSSSVASVNSFVPPTSPLEVAKGTKPFRVESTRRPVLAPPIVLPPSEYSRSLSRSSNRSGRSETSLSTRAENAAAVAAAAAYEDRPGSIRSVSSSSIRSSGFNQPPRSPVTPTRGLWGDVGIGSAAPLSPPLPKFAAGSRTRSPSGSESEGETGFPFGPVSPTGSTSNLSLNAPKFSRSALKRSDVLLPVSAKAADASRASSPSPSLSRAAPSLGLKKHGSSLSMASTWSITGKTVGVGRIAEEPESDAKADGLLKRPSPAPRTISTGSVRSVGSFGSFRTAQEDLERSPCPSPEPAPLQPALKDGMEISDEPLPITPIPSNTGSHSSTSDGRSRASSSDIGHTRSEGCEGKYANVSREPARSSGLTKKKSFKRLLRVLGFSKVDDREREVGAARRSSS